ncbi:cytochrome P450 [Pontivivens nitratireducens]|uniref:cytochrome P450 n=1 Tax=Pontivivens nitratireducens TaxID=2758038 RepID=UPI00163A9DBA|nr:cytochrome P450 [Pontibrevibacter nitratireducens]
MHSVNDYANLEPTLRVPDLKQALYDADPLFLTSTVVSLHGEEHKRKRRVVQSLFTREFFRQYQNRVFPLALDETLAPVVAAGRGDLGTFSYRVLVNLVADAAGLDRDHTEAQTDRMLEIITKLGKAPTIGQMLSGSIDEARAEIQEALDLFKVSFYEHSAARRRALIAKKAEDPSVDLPRDMLVCMLQAFDGEIEEDQLVRDTAFFILAGAFTQANALQNTMWEILTWCSAHPETRAELLTDPATLQKFIWESLRLHPASPVARRKALCPMDLPDGASVDEEEIVDVNIGTGNRDNSVFGDDAATFNPYRELPRRVPLYGATFGAGAHACVGRILAAGMPMAVAGDEEGETEYGTLYLVVQALLEAGIEFDPDEAPVIDESTERKHFESFPFVLRQGQA